MDLLSWQKIQAQGEGSLTGSLNTLLHSWHTSINPLSYLHERHVSKKGQHFTATNDSWKVY